MVTGTRNGRQLAERDRAQAAQRSTGDTRPPKRVLRLPGILLGLGLGGFVDGIVLHQLLQWHHMVSDTARWPVTTVAGLEMNTLWDGVFHAGAWVVTMAGVWLLWEALRDGAPRGSGRALAGLLALGWGLFNIVEGTINHQLLGIHHVRHSGADAVPWEIANYLFSAALVALGWWLYRGAGEPAAERVTA